jgi:hypothetical protein
MKIKLKELKTKKKFQDFLKKTNPEANGILPIEKGEHKFFILVIGPSTDTDLFERVTELIDEGHGDTEIVTELEDLTGIG